MKDNERIMGGESEYAWYTGSDRELHVDGARKRYRDLIAVEVKRARAVDDEDSEDEDVKRRRLFY